MAFRRRADDGLRLNAGLVGSFVFFQGVMNRIDTKPYIFVIFQGRSGREPLSTLRSLFCRCTTA